MYNFLNDVFAVHPDINLCYGFIPFTCILMEYLSHFGGFQPRSKSSVPPSSLFTFFKGVTSLTTWFSTNERPRNFPQLGQL